MQSIIITRIPIQARKPMKKVRTKKVRTLENHYHFYKMDEESGMFRNHGRKRERSIGVTEGQHYQKTNHHEDEFIPTRRKLSTHSMKENVNGNLTGDVKVKSYPEEEKTEFLRINHKLTLRSPVERDRKIVQRNGLQPLKELSSDMKSLSHFPSRPIVERHQYFPGTLPESEIICDNENWYRKHEDSHEQSVGNRIYSIGKTSSDVVSSTKKSHHYFHPDSATPSKVLIQSSNTHPKMNTMKQLSNDEHNASQWKSKSPMFPELRTRKIKMSDNLPIYHFDRKLPPIKKQTPPDNAQSQPSESTSQLFSYSSDSIDAWEDGDSSELGLGDFQYFNVIEKELIFRIAREIAELRSLKKPDGGTYKILEEDEAEDE